MATPKKGITFGAFDLFHAGHVLMMEEAKTVCDHLIVCIETIVYDTEAHVLEILRSLDWDVRILGEEYREKDFTGREETLDRCYFNKRPHAFSSSELRERVVDRSELKAVG